MNRALGGREAGERALIVTLLWLLGWNLSPVLSRFAGREDEVSIESVGCFKCLSNQLALQELTLQAVRCPPYSFERLPR